MNSNEQFLENVGIEDDSNKSSALIEKLKSICDNNNRSMLFNEETVEVLAKLYESLKEQDKVLTKYAINQ